MQHDISIIIPTYNRSYTLARALDSVVRQSTGYRQIIVVDDGSTDNTEELINSNYPQVDYVKQKQQGVSAARNLGIKQAKGQWLAFLDSDDAWHIDKLKLQMDALNNNPGLLLCHTNEIWYLNGVLRNQMQKHEKTGGWIFEKCLPMCLISPSSVMIHRSLFDKVGLFDESLVACEDYDLWLRICAFYPVLYCPEPLTFKYGGHEDQLSKKYWGMDRFRIQSLFQLIRSGNLSQENLAKAKNMLNYKTTIYIKGAKKRQKWQEIEYYEKLLQQAELQYESTE